MTNSPRFPGISVLNPCFLEAAAHHIVALESAAVEIAMLTEQDETTVYQKLLKDAQATYLQLAPGVIEDVNLKFITHAHKIAQQQN